MLGKKIRTGALVAILAGGASIAAASPAMAEGDWQSKITNALTGFKSRSWQDSHTDKAATRTVLTTCTETWSTPKPVGSVTLNLFNEKGLFPDQNMGAKTSNCGTFNWGEMQRSDRYYFTLSKVANHDSGVKLTAKSVKQYF
ncbi:hypothetical protein [Paeniglutamicibacter terrestris]|uniref:Uncharacterized protein n=1 Tax=Paeniglutamicibacter terrestris TaxID=2723403 RepID=A0ABX1G0U3_9MICC|nr:hypothetical protein [Paeniglutamicibacter terrestris]NKG19857.1 hypothetical protein [Paeniglutamicibacter terrestris]